MIFFKLEQTIIALRAQLFLFVLVLSSSLFANVGNPTQASSGEPVFIINNGQWSKSVLSKAHLNIGDLWITQTGFVWNLIDTGAF